MKNASDHNLKELIEQLKKAYHWEDKLDAVRIKDSWDKVVGGIFSKHTTGLYVKNRILYVSLDSSVLRNELHMARSKIVKAINKEIGASVLDDLVLR